MEERRVSLLIGGNMKIYRKEWNDGRVEWSFSANNQEKGVKDFYVQVQFPRGDEPTGDYIEGDLIFRLPNGKESPCFLSSYKKNNGEVRPKLVMFKNKQPLRENLVQEQQSLTGNNRDLTGHIDPKITIDPDDMDLPFM